MKDNIDKIIKTVEERMESDALVLDELNKLKAQIEKSEIMPTGEWLDVNEHTAEKKCSNCGRIQSPNLHCSGCGSKNKF